MSARHHPADCQQPPVLLFLAPTDPPLFVTQRKASSPATSMRIRYLCWLHLNLNKFLHFRSTECSSVGMLFTQCPQNQRRGLSQFWRFIAEENFCLGIPSSEPVPILLINARCPLIMQFLRPGYQQRRLETSKRLCFVLIDWSIKITNEIVKSDLIYMIMMTASRGISSISVYVIDFSPSHEMQSNQRSFLTRCCWYLMFISQNILINFMLCSFAAFFNGCFMFSLPPNNGTRP